MMYPTPRVKPCASVDYFYHHQCLWWYPYYNKNGSKPSHGTLNANQNTEKTP